MIFWKHKTPNTVKTSVVAGAWREVKERLNRCTKVDFQVSETCYLMVDTRHYPPVQTHRMHDEVSPDNCG